MRRLATGLFIALYLGAIAWFLGRHVLEGSSSGPAAYFWTWDMFPHYESESVRRTILAETADRKFVQLLPDESDTFRWGNHGDCTRLDLDRRDPSLERVVAQAMQRDHARFGQSDAARITRILVAEHYWPVRLNAAVQDETEEESPAHRRRTYWRVAAEAEVGADGSISWKPAP